MNAEDGIVRIEISCIRGDCDLPSNSVSPAIIVGTSSNHS